MTEKKQWNIPYNLYNAYVSHKFPVSLTHFITERCNARCPHCFVDFKTAENELSLENIEKISLTSGNALRNIAITGGEPFIRDDVFEIADIWYKNSTAQTVAICSNGSMPERIEAFVKKADKEKMPVSFFFSYDFIGEKHSEYRGLKDLHLNVIESYNIVHKYFPKMNATLNITVNADNYSSAVETYKYMRDELKVQNINCTLIRGKKADILSADEWQKIAEVYENIQQALDNDFDSGKIQGYVDNTLTNHLLNAKNKILWKYVLKTFKENKYISPCTAGSLFGVIYSNGDVLPCELLDKPFGNLKDFDYDFSKCWTCGEAERQKNYIKKSKCFCTFECSWLMNIFSSPSYFPLLSFHFLNNIIKSKDCNKE